MQGENVKIGTCDVHRQREVVAEIKLWNGHVIQLCLPVLKEAVNRIQDKRPKR